VLTARLVPVVFNVKYASGSSQSDGLFLSGNVAEMGNWNATWSDALGPLVTPNGQDWTMCTSLPAGKTIEFRLFRITRGGLVVWAGGGVHTYTVPTTGVGSVELQWSD
jgi:beta-amylase